MASIWKERTSIPPRDELAGEKRTQVCVIGAGLCGILTAHELKKRGVEALILEAGSIACGQTAGTTAKITLQHGSCFDKLMRQLGEERAKAFFAMQANAVESYEKMIKEEGVDCGFERQDSCVYSLGDGEAMEREAQAALRLGIEARFIPPRQICLPLKTAGGVRVKGQAQFDPIKFIAGISDGLEIYENTRVINVKGGRVETGKGGVTAEKVIFACHFPFINIPGLYFAKLYTQRSYVLALENAAQADAMYVEQNGEGPSLRSLGELLLLGGGGHRTGREGGGYRLLEAWQRRLYPHAAERARWSAQDGISPDGLPYIGRYCGSEPNWYLAAGFGKWGMTNSMAAAHMLADMCMGEKNELEPILAPTRFSAKVAGRILSMGAQSIKGIAKQALTHPKAGEEDVKAGEGKLISCDGEKLAAYNDGRRLHKVSSRCSHLGCELVWNPDEKSWDCPCHGSRFSADGEVLNGPAQKRLE